MEYRRVKVNIVKCALFRKTTVKPCGSQKWKQGTSRLPLKVSKEVPISKYAPKFKVPFKQK